MVHLAYDGSYPGLLTAIFDIYANKWREVRIVHENENPSILFADIRPVLTDENKADRVQKKLEELIGHNGLHMLKSVFLSELPDREQVIPGCVRYAISQNGDVLSDYGHPDVLRLAQINKMVGREKHRMEAFVRFRLTGDNLFYATIEPDFNVLPLILPHFESRYADQRWLIYDSKRKYGIHYDLQTTEFIHVLPDTGPDRHVLHEKESLYQVLWKDYFQGTTIKSRKNTKLHLQHVPRRYWKYLTEKG